MITVHLIFNAHIDPIWLWPWQAGLDEALATCRSACDRLDAHPDLVFTRGEAWVYQQIETVDPGLFDRIVRHVAAGRWEIAGGWWIQPDCNLPSGFAMQQQIRLGQQYFRDRFDLVPRIAYNVDSFGHAATLPGLMREAGQDRYIMMRPQEHEMSLPARLFRWRGYDNGEEVVTFRIAGAYTTGSMSVEHVQRALTDLPPAVEHTMCFVGVGDHGGGPTEAQIAWCREHMDAIPGCRLAFSSPQRFFDAVAAQTDALPVVTGELQQHAIGCYSVMRVVKVAVRRAEHRLRQAEMMPLAGADRYRLHEAWQRVCFHHFHDTLGGTCLPSAYPQVLDQLGFATAIADERLQSGLRGMMHKLPDDRLQRTVLYNAADAGFAGYVECEPWLGWQQWQPGWRLLDEQGAPVATQVLQPEALSNGLTRLLLHLEIEPRAWRVLRIERANGDPAAPRVEAHSDALSNDAGVAVGPAGLRLWPDASLPLPHLELIEDASDTWSHGLDRYAETPLETARWDAPAIVDSGPLMASLLQSGSIGCSRLQAEWRVYAGEPFVELRLRLHWAETHKLLKLRLDLPGAVAQRRDGIMGGSLQRPNDGRELPLRDWTLLALQDGRSVGVVCPDVYAVDATPERLRLTLLRSALMAHHDPHPGQAARRTVSDQGVHEFRFRFLSSADGAVLEAHALMLQRPPVYADLTRGMAAG